MAFCTVLQAASFVVHDRACRQPKYMRHMVSRPLRRMIKISHDTIGRMIGDAVMSLIENEKSKPRHANERMCQGT